ncbi:MAG: glycosyltransferase family 2 protein [Deltaproteobacteria bacterium]|jgi:glycosyltransferase involved in cell wall biosynthesis|nr:glycosyltransferase family 2 protein [Deltaproteobacteria bacterium]MDA8308545.1 glycosyltransferase family 2 protein [Deltaproteobacteria bacterium]
MKYTVIVPAYNAQDTIGPCIRSLLDQKGVTYGKDYTVLVVDDGSTDRTPEILNTFPVEIMRLPENQGRIVARLTGARRAQTSRVLFVDSRVTLARDAIATLDSFDGHPAVMGETDQTESKYISAAQTVLYLIRRKYYRKGTFPVEDEFTITEQNFKRAAKGTTVLLIDRELFIKLTPERTGKDVNDDTLLFRNLVFGQKIGLFRSRRLYYTYSQRTDARQFTGWLFHRGVRFSDFYLRPGGYFHLPFLLLVAAMAALIAWAFIAGGMVYLAALAIGADAAISLYLSEERRDFIRVLFGLPPIVIIFGGGIASFWAKMLSRAPEKTAGASFAAIKPGTSLPRPGSINTPNSLPPALRGCDPEVDDLP